MKKSIAAVTTVCLFFIVSSDALSAQTSPTPRYGGTLRLGYDHKPHPFNPLITNGSVSAGIVALVFSRLIRLNEHGQLEPDIAQRWEISPDGLIYTFFLRKDISFHDGVILTSKDILFTYNKIIELGNKSPYSRSFENVQKVDAEGDHIVRFILKKPSAPFIHQLVREIVPEHLYKHLEDDNSPINWKPVGSGPFRFLKKTDSDILLKANQSYYEGRPYLDYVQYKLYKNRDEIWAALMQKKVDLMIFMKVDDYEITRRDQAFQTFAYPGPEQYVLVMNSKDPLLKDSILRKALGYAINRRQLINIVENGYGSESYKLFYSSSKYTYNSDDIFYSPEAARELLHQRGWVFDIQSGLMKKNKKELKLHILADSRKPKMRKIISVLRQQFHEIGIKLLVRFYEDDEPNFKTEPYQLHLRMYQGHALDPHEVVKDWHSKDSHKGQIYKRSDSEHMDKLISLGEGGVSQRIRSIIYRNIQNHISRELSRHFLYFPHSFHTAFQIIGNASLYLNLYMPDHNIRSVFLKP